jgi:hypothetical protein
MLMMIPGFIFVTVIVLISVILWGSYNSFGILPCIFIGFGLFLKKSNLKKESHRYTMDKKKDFTPFLAPIEYTKTWLVQGFAQVARPFLWQITKTKGLM